MSSGTYAQYQSWESHIIGSEVRVSELARTFGHAERRCDTGPYSLKEPTVLRKLMKEMFREKRTSKEIKESHKERLTIDNPVVKPKKVEKI